jgi:hypothetical protein
LGSGAAEQIRDGINNPRERLWREHADFLRYEITAGCEQFAWPHIARHTKRTGCERRLFQWDRSGIPVRLARDLTEHTITTTGIRQNNSGTQFGFREI